MALRFPLTLCIAAALLARSRAQYRASAWIGGGGSTLSGFAAGGVGGNAASLASKPFGVAWSGPTFYFTDYSNSRIRAVNGSAPVWSVAGGGSATGTASGYANGVGSAALFYVPTAVVPLGGSVFTLDNFPGVRAIALATSTVSVLAGGAGAATTGYADGVGTNAKFAAAPYGMCSDGANALFVADINNHVVRAVVIATAAVSTLAGSLAGYANGVGVAAKLNQPAAVAFAAGVVYVVENGNHAVRTITVTGAAVAPFVGGGANGITAGVADGVGSNALFRTPQGCATSPDGVLLYVADTGNNRVRVVNIAAKLVSTAGGGGGAAGTLAGYANGLGTNALFNYPTGVAVDPATGALSVGDVNNNIIRTLTPPAPVWSFPADQGTGLGGFTLINNPAYITFGPDRNSCPGGALYLQNSAYMATTAVVPELPTGNAPRSGSVWIVCSSGTSVYEWGGGGGAANARSGTLASAWGIVGEGNDCFLTGSVCNGVWNHLAFSYDTGNNMILYLNGAAVKTCASSASVAARARARAARAPCSAPSLTLPPTHALYRARSAGARRDSLEGVCWLQRQPRAHWRRAVRPQRHRRLH